MASSASEVPEYQKSSAYMSPALKIATTEDAPVAQTLQDAVRSKSTVEIEVRRYWVERFEKERCLYTGIVTVEARLLLTDLQGGGDMS